MGFQLPFPQLSNENNPGWLDVIGDYTTQWYRDYDKPFFTDPYFSQPGFNGKDQRVFCRGSTGAFLPDFCLPSTEMDLPCRTLCGSSTSPPRWICPCSRTYASDVVVTQETRSERNWVGHNIGSIYDMYICLCLIMFNSIWDSCFFCIFAYTLMVALIWFDDSLTIHFIEPVYGKFIGLKGAGGMEHKEWICFSSQTRRSATWRHATHFTTHFNLEVVILKVPSYVFICFLLEEVKGWNPFNQDTCIYCLASWFNFCWSHRGQSFTAWLDIVVGKTEMKTMDVVFVAYMHPWRLT